MTDDGQDLADAQLAHWQHAYAARPGMYEKVPSTAVGVFRRRGP
ncbi:hypothetical protein [Streptomyces sp. NPDC058335]